MSLKREDIKNDLVSLARLQASHLTRVPFENLDVYGGNIPPCDAKLAVMKILKNRGGWCYEVNAAFGWLLESLGFMVRRYGAAVLINRPNTVPSHLCVEVVIADVPYLVDVGFGDSFMNPLRLLPNSGIQNDPVGKFEIVEGEDKHFTLYKIENGARKPCYRVVKVERSVKSFEEISRIVGTNPELPFKTTPFATRLLDGGPDRVTILEDKIKFRRNGEWTEQPLSKEQWQSKLFEWFEFRTE